MKQQVLNYECDVIQKQAHPGQVQFRINDPHHHRYSPWKLQQTIQRYLHKPQYSVKWIGCDPYSHALSFLYCMLVGCLQADETTEDLFIKFKYSLYQESKQTLSIQQQKIFVQHLGLIEDSKNIGQFLKKSSHLENIFIKIFSVRCSQMAQQSLKNNASIKHSKMQQLQWYSAIFPFCSFIGLNQKCSNVTINRQNFYIIQQKQCYFIVEQIGNKLASCRISQVQSKKRQKTEICAYGMQYFDSLKTIDALESKQQTTQDFDKNKMIPSCKSETKLVQKVLTPTESEDRSWKQFMISDAFSTVKMTASQQNRDNKQSGYDINKKGTVKLNNYKKQASPRQPKLSMNQNMRTSIRYYRPSQNDPTPKMYSERVSQEKNKSRNKTNKSITKNQIIQQQQQKLKQVKQKDEGGTNRANFIYQSLNPNQLPIENNETSQKFIKKVPKFLLKKTQDTFPYTFSSSPIKADISPPKHAHPATKKQKQPKIGVLSHKNVVGVTIHSVTPDKRVGANPGKEPIHQLERRARKQ